MKPLDFIIVGAQKSATTSLFRYLGQQPGIFVPAEKELCFFSEDAEFDRGWSKAARPHFRHANIEDRWGVATPKYFVDPVVPMRIRARMPGTRLIAILRDPVERAMSHYKMAVRRGAETRSLEAAFEELLTLSAADQHAIATRRAMGLTPDIDCYLAWSRYGLFLSRYLRFFEPEQVLVLITEELASDPEETLRASLRHIGLDGATLRGDLTRRHHVGGRRRRIGPFGAYRVIDRVLSISPVGMRHRLKMLVNRWNTIPEPNERLYLRPDLRLRLAEYFRADVCAVEQYLGRPVPWLTRQQPGECREPGERISA